MSFSTFPFTVSKMALNCEQQSFIVKLFLVNLKKKYLKCAFCNVLLAPQRCSTRSKAEVYKHGLRFLSALSLRSLAYSSWNFGMNCSHISKFPLSYTQMEGHNKFNMYSFQNCIKCDFYYCWYELFLYLTSFI